VFDGIEFATVVVDEACQVTEPLSLLPALRFKCERMILVGDPLQLPPTLDGVNEYQFKGKGLERTLFERAMQMGIQPIQLTVQYRACPIVFWSSGVVPLSYCRYLQLVVLRKQIDQRDT
jgi:superfamily I DNA and/or RNA helicase